MATATAMPGGKAKRSKKAATEDCWHLCPEHAKRHPRWERLGTSEQIALGVVWKHQANSAVLDEYERLCPGCRAAKREGGTP